MTLLAFGINHKTAPIALREKLAIEPRRHGTYLQQFMQQTAVTEAAVLSTCNRHEFYCASLDAVPMLEWLAQYHDLSTLTLSDHIYQLNDEAAMRHLMRVACGLDSMAMGEPQILGQVKHAYHLARDLGAIGRQLDNVFQRVFRATKQVRGKTELGIGPTSIAYACAQLPKCIFSDLSVTNVCLVGAGQTIELVMQYLKQQGVKRFTVVNRTAAQAAQLAQIYGGVGVAFAELTTKLTDADIIISATASPLPIIGKGSIESCLKTRRHKPLLLIDIAVPRDIEPQVAELNDVFLYNIDDLQTIIQDSHKQRQQAAVRAEQIIETELNKYLHWRRMQRASHAIKHYREVIQQQCDHEMKKALQAIQQGKPAASVIQQLTHVLQNKALHHPTLGLRQVASCGDEDLMKLVQTLFADSQS